MSEVRISTEPSIDSKTYVVTLAASDDVAVILTPDRALQYALGILRAAHHAAYDAAVLRQMTIKVGVPMEAAAEVVGSLRADRPPLDHEATRPLRLEPGVNKHLEPFLVISVNGEQLGQWSVEDAEQHAMFVLSTVVVADLDSAYYRALTGLVNIEEPRARNIVADLANHRDLKAVD
jgi:hypothetical protein